MSTTALLEVSALAYSTPDGRPLFENLNFAVSGGQLLLICGPNGSGKSTLLKLLRNELTPARGLIRCTVDCGKIGFLPQLQNIAFHLPLKLQDVVSLLTGRPGPDVLPLGLLKTPDLENAWNTASGGERQRTLLSCLLLNSPDLLMLDEPFNHLDRESQLTILQALEMFILQGSSRAVVLVSHRVLTLPDPLKKQTVLVALSTGDSAGV